MYRMPLEGIIAATQYALFAACCACKLSHVDVPPAVSLTQSLLILIKLALNTTIGVFVSYRVSSAPKGSHTTMTIPLMDEGTSAELRLINEKLQEGDDYDAGELLSVTSCNSQPADSSSDNSLLYVKVESTSMLPPAERKRVSAAEGRSHVNPQSVVIASPGHDDDFEHGSGEWSLQGPPPRGQRSCDAVLTSAQDIDDDLL